MKQYIIYLIIMMFGVSYAQKQDTLQDVAYIYKGNKALKETQFVEAEAQYRKAISENPSNPISKFNLGNAYYKNKKTDEALSRFNQAQKVAETKSEKHSAFHNMGNSFMQKKEFDKAIEMYKNALRNNPTDDETRYNLALAKQEKDKQDKENEKNKDKKDDKKKDGKDKNKDKKDDKKDKDKDGEDKKDKSDKSDDKKDKDKKEDDKADKNKDKPNEDPKKDKGDKKDEQKPKPKPGQLSLQQVQQLLQAMDNQEQKLQQKLNAKKGKGVPMQNDKDW